MLKSTLLFVSSKYSNTTLLIIPRSFIKNHRSCFSFKSQPTSEIILRRLENQNINRVDSVKLFHTTSTVYIRKQENYDKILMNFTEFEKQETKDKKTFLETVRVYEENFQTRKNVVDFIRIALKNMEEYGVDKDLDSYKRLMNLFPKGVYVATNVLLGELHYYPRETFLGNDILAQMNVKGVHPDLDMANTVVKIFGKYSFVRKRMNRMLYWNLKMKNKSPWPVPWNLTSDPLLLAKLAIERITSVDLLTDISIFKTENVPDSLHKTWIVSAQSPKQKELLASHSPETPVVVEGGEVVWLRSKFISYFVLKADSGPRPYHHPESADDINKMEIPFFNPNYQPSTNESPSVHEQDDGIIYAVCATGTSTKDSLLSWVRLLQKHGNPILEKVPVLFRLKTAERTLVPFSDALVPQQEKA